MWRLRQRNNSTNGSSPALPLTDSHHVVIKASVSQKSLTRTQNRTVCDNKKEVSFSIVRGDLRRIYSWLWVCLFFGVATLFLSKITFWSGLQLGLMPTTGPLGPSRTSAVVPSEPALPKAPLADYSLSSNVAWLMSFPNSGTSFTIHMARSSSNCTTATNYGLEGEIRDEPSVPAIQGEMGEYGPFLELIPDVHTTMPRYILTKTHCSGHCTGECTLQNDYVTPRAFEIGCLSGVRGMEDINGTLIKVPVTYSPELVAKAIHIFRHPLDNIVARFHLARKRAVRQNDNNFLGRFSDSKEGFRAWCEDDDLTHRQLLRTPFVDSALHFALKSIPCFNEFFRYVQWHNNAFAVIHDLGIPTLLFHYEEYAEDFTAARDKILSFLELPLINEGEAFVPGKIYHDYYTDTEKESIQMFIAEFASVETWNQMRHYHFE